jgi:hypothetical protein
MTAVEKLVSLVALGVVGFGAFRIRKYWNAAKRTFAHQGINKLRTATRLGFGTWRAVVQKCERRGKCEFLHTEKENSMKRDIVG